MVALEHRFFGESYPTPDMSNTNLRYLTSSQVTRFLNRFHALLRAMKSHAAGARRSGPVHRVPPKCQFERRRRQCPAAHSARLSVDEPVRDIRWIVPG